MSDIPKSERKESKLDALNTALDIRVMIQKELLLSFGLSEKKQKEQIRRMMRCVPASIREDEVKRITEMNENYDVWLIMKERDRILDYCQDIVMNLTSGNTIHPVYWSEYYQRRGYLNEAMASCNRLKSELLFLSTALPSDKNRYMQISLKIEKCFNMIKKLRQSDNRYKKNLKKDE